MGSKAAKSTSWLDIFFRIRSPVRELDILTQSQECDFVMFSFIWAVYQILCKCEPLHANRAYVQR